MNIGGGITIGGGVTLTVPASGGGGGPASDYITVATYGPGNDNAYIWGATTGSYPVAGGVGTVVSNYISDLFNFELAGNDNTGYTYLYVINGTYSGFSIANGVIDGDVSTYPRTFTIDGSDYVFMCYPYGYFATSDVASLKNKVGQDVSITYNPANQGAAPTANTMLIKSYTYPTSGNTVYGASGYFNYLTFGGLYSQYFQAITYQSSTTDTTIALRDGNYTTFTVTNGAIDSDTNGSTKKFTIDGTEVTGTFATSTLAYTVTGDPLSLATKVDSTVNIVYDPAAQSGGGGGSSELVSGTMIVGYNNTSLYGWQAGSIGSSTLSMMGPVIAIKYDASYPRTEINFLTGTYGSVEITNSTVGGEATVTAVIGGITEALEMDGNGRAIIAGDPFGFASKVGETLAISVTPGATGGGGSVTYTSGTDYDNGTSTSPGIFIDSVGASYMVVIDPGKWTNSAGYTALAALTTGGTFTTTMPLTGSTTFTITLTSGWNSAGPGLMAQATASPSLTLAMGSDNVPSTITLAGSGGSSSFAPEYTSDPGGNPWPTTADYSYVTYHDMFGLTVKGMKSSSALYTFFSTAATGDTFDVVFSGTTYTFTLGDYNSSASVYAESNGVTNFYRADLPPFIASVSPSLSAGEGTTLYGTLVTLPSAGGSGGGATTYTSSGNWNYSNWQSAGGWRITLGLSSNPDSAMLTKLNALTSGSSITLSDGINTQTVTVSYTTGPWSSSQTVEIYTNTGSTTGSYASIASITL